MFSNYFTVTRLLSTNSNVAANLQKVIRVLVGLLMQRTSCHMLMESWFCKTEVHMHFESI